ncbi:hypothetical protein BDZ85DRAFT_59406 [Elsinoe ampelina]|uniref:Uncharacterized protein n=1 Tax=Elsinoe ampelina TaxID=302913 RepID=A0A6A6G025_9PEZI|nr:hypothetical protein BDZ85DRAFT_59406 [Elsinoe ampelina]
MSDSRPMNINLEQRRLRRIQKHTFLSPLWLLVAYYTVLRYRTLPVDGAHAGISSTSLDS